MITGGSGLLGSKIASIASEKGFEPYSGYNEHTAINGTPIKLDICNKNMVEKAFEIIRPEVVVHAAALTNVDKCEENQELAQRVNIEGTRNIIEASERYNAFLIYVSTDYVFSGEEGMYKEHDTPIPINFYGWTKLKGEILVALSSIEWCIVRPSVIYGSTPAAGKVNFALWVLNKLEKGESMRIITDQWVSPTLNTNLAEMILEIMERKVTGIYHLAGATPINRYDFSTLLADIFGLDKNLISTAKSSDMKWLAERPKNTSLNVEKALTNLQCKPLKIPEAFIKLKEEMTKSKIGKEM